MHKNVFKKLFMPVVLIYGMLMLGSCVDEPTIPHVKIPFTLARFGNLTSNKSSLDFYVDGNKVASTMEQNKFTDYMEFVSGSRILAITDAATQDTIFKGKFPAGSYEEMSVFAAGYYSDILDSSSFAVTFHSEGLTYLREGVADSVADSLASCYVFHGAGPGPGEKDVSFNITASADGDSTAFPTVKPGEVTSLVLPVGTYSFSINGEVEATDTGRIIDFSHTIVARKRNNIYLSGDPSNLVIGFEELDPLEARSK